MNIEELKTFLYKIGIPKSSYNIDSDETVITPGTIILKRVSTGVSVYWTEYTNNVILKMRLKLFRTFYFCLKVAPIHIVDMY